MPEKPHDDARDVGMKPTGTKDGLAKLIFQIGHGVVPDPPVYRFPLLSPVSPSIARGVETTVVNVAFFGNWGGPASADDPRPVTKKTSKPVNHRAVIDVSSC
jgi:hypothetical protein